MVHPAIKPINVKHVTMTPPKVPHDWTASTLGHGNQMCSRCLITDLEARAIGQFLVCDVPPPEGWAWFRAVGAEYLRHEPSPGHVYRLVRVSARSKKYFAKYNDVNLPSAQTKIYWGKLEEAKEVCVNHFNKLTREATR